ncbi:MAG: serine/threonine-protein kinase, partial [Myxococcota bacterium]
MSRYHLLHPIGKGGMGTVWEARRILPGGDEMRVACKCLRGKRLGERKYLELFRKEAAVSLQVTNGHPGLITVYDCLQDRHHNETQIYIIMELIRGCSLAALLREYQSFSPATAGYIATHLMDALDYLHSRGIMHRDIAPANILIDRQGTLKLADLGLATWLTSAPVHDGHIRGTPGYISPEACHGLAVDPRSDLYSAGAVLYHLLQGVAPSGSGGT